jgi:hypothetical protein
MHDTAMTRWRARLTFREGVWLVPVACPLHVLEEVPSGTVWAQRDVSACCTRHDSRAMPRLGVPMALRFPSVIWCFPPRAVVLLVFAFVFTFAACLHTLCHAQCHCRLGRLLSWAPDRTHRVSATLCLPQSAGLACSALASSYGHLCMRDCWRVPHSSSGV